MADGFNRFNPGGQFFYHNQQSSHPRNLHHRNGSPINSSRSLFSNADTPSPNRSPGTNSPAHNPYGMYNHGNHRQNHGLLNGGAGHQAYGMNVPKSFHSGNHGQQGHHVSNHHADHGQIGGHGGYGNHQHNISASTLSNTTPHFTPAHLQNGTPDNSGSIGKPTNEAYAEHLREYNKLKMAGEKPHFYARTSTAVSRLPGATPSTVSSRQDADEHGVRGRVSDESEEQGMWDAMDFTGHGLKSMGASLFRHYPHLRKLFFGHNRLLHIPPHISCMRFLTVVDLSFNQIRDVPPEICMLTNLKRLILFDNELNSLPQEMGSLYQLEFLGLEGNPMREAPDQMDQLREHGTAELIRYLREESQPPLEPEEREWHTILEESDAPEKDRFTIASWNTLCDRAATQAAYGYTPSRALAWNTRRNMIFEELRTRHADIMTLQEVDSENYHEYFAPNLAHFNYKGVFAPKGRARTMSDREAKSVDGCATFWKADKYIMLDKFVLNYSNDAISRPDMKGDHDVYNRVMPKDHIALFVFLENRLTGTRLIIVNTHLTWEPWFHDVKLVQTAILMDYLTKKSEEWRQVPPTNEKTKKLFRYSQQDGADGPNGTNGEDFEPQPSTTYESGTQIPILVCGDFNSTQDSGVYDLITQGSLSNSHSDLGAQKYGDLTRHGISHPFSLKSSYSPIGELPFTNWTPDFREVIDYVWYSTNSLQVTGVLGQVDPDYMSRVPGFPNFHFPSDHLLLMAEYGVKERKERKQAVEADFGPSSRRDREGGRS